MRQSRTAEIIAKPKVRLQKSAKTLGYHRTNREKSQNTVK